MGSKARRGSTDKESSKSENKFNKKLQFYTKVRDTVASLSAKKAISKKKRSRSRQKKLKPYDLTSLSEFLPELKASPQPPPETNLKLNRKSRMKLVEKEGKKFNTVLEHPAFQADPLAAIHAYLESTQPVQTKKPEKRPNKNGNRANRKKSKALSGSHSMEIS